MQKILFWFSFLMKKIGKKYINFESLKLESPLKSSYAYK